MAYFESCICVKMLGLSQIILVVFTKQPMQQLCMLRTLYSYMILNILSHYWWCVQSVQCALSHCWLEVSIRKVLRPATSAQVVLGFPVSNSEC